MKTSVNFFGMLLISTLFCLASCSKDGDGGEDGDGNGNQQPVTKAETEQKIQGKWNISGSADIQSIEFVGSDTYVLGISATSPLIASSSSPRNTVSTGLKATGGRLKAEGSSASGAVFITGTYQISADGKTITLELEDLEEKIIITVNNLSEQNFSFTVKIGNEAAIEVSSTSVTIIDNSNKTTLLSRTWVFPNWPSTFSQKEITELTKLGLKLQDMKHLFTKSGTLIMPVLEVNVATSPTPEPPGQPLPDQYSYTLSHEFAVWEWKDSQQNAIKITLVDPESGLIESFEAKIETLSATNLKFSTWPGDVSTLELVSVP